MLSRALLLLAFSLSFSFAFAQTELTITDSLQGNYVFKGYVISGNKRTKAKIIEREVPILLYDTIAGNVIPSLCARAQNNIYNLALFNFVFVQPVLVENSKNFYLKIEVVERWYIWPVPIFENAETNFNTWWEQRALNRTNYGAFLRWDNFRGLNDRLVLVAQFGYTQKFELRYSIPNINKAQTLGLEFASTLFQNWEVTHGTVNNERLFFSMPNQNASETVRHRSALTYRPNFYVFHRLDVSYQRSFTLDTVVTFAPDFFDNGTNTMAFMALQYDFLFDNRDYRYYPLKGLFFGVNIRQEGLGVVNNEYALTTIYPFYNQFFKLSDRLFYGHSARGKWSSTSNIPYFRQRGLGFGEEVVRGYQYYVIDGQHYFLTKQNIKWMLVRPKEYHYRLTGKPQFDKFHFAMYLNWFIDTGYVWDDLYALQNPLANEYLYATGVGLDVVAYYDSVLRLEVATNKQRETGFFVGFTKAF
ncbi:MAG: hypothetical protein ACXITV_10450 [Luteibaculaceae bacterium]